MSQSAPYPAELEEIVSRLRYRPGWRFELKDFERDPGSAGLTFVVRSLGYDTYHPEKGETYGVLHYFPVPPATYNQQSWLEWVRDRLIEIETHEVCEFMRLEVADSFEEDGPTPVVRPFAPNHGPGWNPYVVRSLNTAEAAETTFRGIRRAGTQGGASGDEIDAALERPSRG
jgi:hypothetical protein